MREEIEWIEKGGRMFIGTTTNTSKSKEEFGGEECPLIPPSLSN